MFPPRPKNLHQHNLLFQQQQQQQQQQLLRKCILLIILVPTLAFVPLHKQYYTTYNNFYHPSQQQQQLPLSSSLLYGTTKTTTKTTATSTSTFLSNPIHHDNNNNNNNNKPDPNHQDHNQCSSDCTFCVEVVLFGVGDLRVDDHLGLYKAIQSGNTVVPMILVPIQSSSSSSSSGWLKQIPGAMAHTIDTIAMLSCAYQDLDTSLQETIHPDMNLHIMYTSNHNNTEYWLREIQNYVSETINLPASKYNTTTTTTTTTKFVPHIRLHVCDLGPADNAMGYGMYSQFTQNNVLSSSQQQQYKDIEIIPWDNNLRNFTFVEADQIPDTFPDYERQFVQSTDTTPPPLHPVTIPHPSIDQIRTATDPNHKIPTIEFLHDQFLSMLPLDQQQRCQMEQNSGLYGTHWGGVPATTIGCCTIWEALDVYCGTDCQQKEQRWMTQYCPVVIGTIQRNPRSLEHASMIWQIQNDQGNLQADHWLAGESMVRILAAPLLYGTVSPRRVWHTAASNYKTGWLFPNPLQQLVESQEWHRRLAARNIATDTSYNNNNNITPDKTRHKYWRYHGFLCRYAETDLNTHDDTVHNNNNISKEKEGILLIHGFGASGAQWNKIMQELAHIPSSAAQQGLAPDLLGFGHSEKPALSYTGYLWDSQMLDFLKEIALYRNGWTSFVTGGNSIGGYTSMSLAACDTATVQERQVTSSGAPGTNKCTGLVLMNSAGPIKSKAEISLEVQKGLQTETIAQATCLDALPGCRPPPRPLSRLIGNVLLSYLRPRVQSICVNLYPTNPDAVNAILCNGIRRDSLDPGAIHVMMAGTKLPPPRTANELLAADYGSARYSCRHVEEKGHTIGVVDCCESFWLGPVLVAQGVLDPLNNATDRMNRYQALRGGIVVDPIQAGHCPHDEQPREVAMSVARWMTDRSFVEEIASSSTATVRTDTLQ